MVRGHRVPDEFIGQFRDSSAVDDARELRRRLADSGYVFLRGVIDKDEVLTAREEVFSRVIKVGEIEPPAIEGIVTGGSRFSERRFGTFFRTTLKSEEQLTMRYRIHVTAGQTPKATEIQKRMRRSWLI